MKTRIARVLAQALLVFVSCCSLAVHAAAFTPGNIVVVRVGDGAAALASTATASFLDEYTPAGALVQSIPLPTSVNAGNKRLTLSGTATSEGLLTRSADGKYLVLVGYDADLATASITSSSSTLVNRVVGRVGTSGVVDTTTALSDASTGSNPRGAATTDGTDIWVTGGAGGTRYTIFGATTSTQLSTSPTNVRGVLAAGGNLYITSGSAPSRIMQVGTGLPTAAGQTAVNLPGIDGTATTGNSVSPYQFFFADLDPTEPGLDTLYVADDGTSAPVGGIRKYSKVSGTWALNSTVGTGTNAYRGITGVVNGSSVTLYLTRTGATAGIYTAVDSTGYNAAMTAVPSTTPLVTQATNTAFRGIAMAPEQASTPTNRTVTLSVSSTTTSEGGAAVTVTATTDGVVSGAKTVDLATSGTASAGDYSLSGTTITIADGASSGSVTLTPVDDALPETNEVVSLNLTNPSSGLTIGTPAMASVTIADNDAQTVTISSSATTGTEAGASVITLTASVSSPTTSEQSVQLQVSGQGITAGDYTLSSTTIVIPSGATSGSVTLTIVNDSDMEPNETITLTLTSPSSGLVVGAPSAANILISDDDTPVTRIFQIQGTLHISPFQGQVVNNVPGIVTEVRSNGYFMQDAGGDANDNTSDGIFVFTSTAPTGVAVGNLVQVTGTVFEFRPDCTTGNNNLSCTNDAQYNLTATQIGYSGATPTTVTISTGNSLPNPVVLGAGGRMPPTSRVGGACASPNIEDASCTPDPTGNAIDFFETLEGMRVRVNNPMAVSGQMEFDEFWVVGDAGVNATGVSGRGALTITANDSGGERILMNLTGTGAAANLADLRTGDRWTGAFDGILNYSFGDYKVDLPSGFVMPVATTRHGLGKEVTALVGTTNGLTIGSYNVENLAGTSPQSKFDELAAQIVTNLKAPDVLALMEVQDNDGTSGGCNATVSASTTYSRLTAAIATAGGPSYQVVQIDPGVCTDGGANAGNIRVAFLYNPARVGFTPVAGGGTNVNTQVVNVGGEPRLQHNPGRIDPANTAFTASRKPLAAEFTFNGKRFIAIANHWNSKGGDGPEHGRIQPFSQVTQPQRVEISNVVKGFVQSALNIDAQARIVVVGDLNDFPWSTPVTNLVATTPALTPLSNLLLTNERYTYIFRGNGQVLDYIIVSPGLAQGAEYDIVHVNAEYAVQVSDHEPEVARLQIAPTVVEPPGTLARAQDMNGDGRSDVVYRNASTGQVYRFLANGLTLSGGAIAYNEADTAWDIVGDGDFDGNGHADLLYRNSVTGQVAIVRYGAGVQPIGAAVVHTEPSALWQIVRTPDVDGDGRSDLVWWNSTTGQVYVMLMNGNTIKAQGVAHNEPDTQWRIVGSGDFTASGKQNGLLWRNMSSGAVYLQTLAYAQGSGFTPSGAIIWNEPSSQWRIVATADFSGDGKADILWRNTATGLVWMMIMDGGAIASQGPVHNEPSAAWVIVAHGDYDGNGKADLLWRNSSSGAVYMMLMDGRTIASQGAAYAEPDTAWEVMGPGSY